MALLAPSAAFAECPFPSSPPIPSPIATHADPILARAVALDIVRALRGAGHTALLAGGCVRDALLGNAPTDFDVATSAQPAQLRALFPRTHDVGEAFGVMLVRDRGVTVEVATFRSDGPYTDRRRPDSVAFSDPMLDAQRRDFTINALFLDPLPKVPQPALPGAPAIIDHAQGRIIDYVGGAADLKARVLRAVGDPNRRLDEDHLRALRAVRFTARLGFDLDPATARAIRDHAAGLRGVSRERIGDELRRMLAHPARASAIALLHELGLDAPALDQPASSTPSTPTPHLRILAGLESARTVGEPVPTAVDLGAALAAWALDLSAPAAPPKGLVAHWRGALCLSNDERDDFAGTLTALESIRTRWETSPVAAQKRLAASARFPAALGVLAAAEPDRAAAVREGYRVLAGDGIGIKPDPFVTGDDLVASGFTPGRGFKTLLDRLYDEQLEGRVKNRAQALELARGLRV